MSPSGTFSGRWHEIFFQVLLGFQMKIWGEKKKKNLPNCLYTSENPIPEHYFTGNSCQEHGLNFMFICKALALTACLSHLQAYLSSFSPTVRHLVLLLKSLLITCSTPVYMYSTFRINLNHHKKQIYKPECKVYIQFLLSVILQCLIKVLFSLVTHDNKSPFLSVIMSYIHNTAKYICVHFFLALADNLINFL